MSAIPAAETHVAGSADRRPSHLVSLISVVTFTKFSGAFFSGPIVRSSIYNVYTPVPFTLLFTLLLLFLKSVCSSRAGERRLFIFYRLPSRRPCVVVSLALFLFSCFLLWSCFLFFTLLLGARVLFHLVLFYVKRRAVGGVIFFSLIEPHTELWSLKDNLYYGNLGCV